MKKELFINNIRKFTALGTAALLTVTCVPGITWMETGETTAPGTIRTFAEDTGTQSDVKYLSGYGAAKTCSSATLLADSVPAEDLKTSHGEEKWYYVSEEEESCIVYGELSVAGTLNIILNDSTDISFDDINIKNDGALNIYGVSDDMQEAGKVLLDGCVINNGNFSLQTYGDIKVSDRINNYSDMENYGILFLGKGKHIDGGSECYISNYGTMVLYGTMDLNDGYLTNYGIMADTDAAKDWGKFGIHMVMDEKQDSWDYGYQYRWYEGSDLLVLGTFNAPEMGIVIGDDALVRLKGNAKVKYLKAAGDLTIETGGTLSATVTGKVDGLNGALEAGGNLTVKAGTVNADGGDYACGVYAAGTFKMWGGTVNADSGKGAGQYVKANEIDIAGGKLNCHGTEYQETSEESGTSEDAAEEEETSGDTAQTDTEAAENDSRTDESESSVMDYSDVKAGSWYYDAVKYVTENGLMKGVSADSFSPNTCTTRGMTAVILYRYDGGQDVTYAVDSKYFKDVKARRYYTYAVDWGYGSGIMNGTSEDLFEPDGELTREAFVTMLCRYAEYKGQVTVTDADLDRFYDRYKVDEWAYDAMAWAVEKGILSGYEDGTLRPENGITRAEMASMMMRLSEAGL